MDLLQTTVSAFQLLFSGDAELWRIIFVSLKVALTALVLTVPVALPTGYFLATTRFPGRRSIVIIIQGLLSFPTVVVGLILYMLLSRQGPLGFMHLLFSPTAMILGQMMIAFPILVAFTISAVQGADPRARETAISLGASKGKAALTTICEVKFGVMVAIFNGFGRIISEVGAALMLGGNIAGLTRNIPTSIALETSKGEFAQGIALGFVLIAIALGLNFTLAHFQGEGGLK